MFGNSLFGNNQQKPATGGLFGNQPQQTGGLFGQPSAQQGQSTNLWGNQGGAFGNQQQNQMNPPAGGLFGQAQPSTNQGGGLFGQQPKTGGGLFGSQPQQNQGMSLFGQSSQPAQPAQQSSLFGASGTMGMANQQPNMSAPSVFGASAQTTQPSSGLFSGFGSQNQQQPAQQSSLFGSTQMGGSSGLFGAAQNPNQGSSIFGSTQQTQPQPGSSLFGNQPQNAQQTGGLFGSTAQQTGTGLFGSANQSGVAQSSSIFGGGMQNKPQMNAGSSLFGSTTANQPNQIGGGGLFGSTGQQQNTNQMGMGNQPFGGGFNQNTGFGAQTTTANLNIQGTYSIRYQVTTVDEPSFNKQAGGAQKPIPIKLISITAMNEYSHKSLEELRIEDYRIKKSGVIPPMQNAAPGMGVMGSQPFGGVSQGLFGQQQQNQQQSSGLFGAPSGAQQNQQQGGLFGASQQSSLFGKPQQAQTQGQQGGFGLFGSSSASNLGTGLGGNAPQGGLFGQQNAQSSLFGASKQAGQGTSLFGSGQTQPQTSSLFGAQTQPNQSNQPQAQQGAGGLFGMGLGQNQQQGGLFAAPQAQQSQQQTGGLFGSSAQPQSSLGSGLFGQTTQQSQQSGGLFGQQAQQPQQTGGLFGAQPASQSSGGLFGAVAQKPTGGLFGAASTAQGAGSSLFGQASSAAPQPQSSLFGSGPSSSLFGGQTQQSTGSSLFGGTQPAKATSGLFGAPSQPTTSLFGGQTGTSSLFGGTSNQAQLGQQPSSLFGDNTQKGGLFGSAGATQPGDLNAFQYQNIPQGARPTNAYLDLLNVGKKSIEEVLEDIQKDYLEAQFDNSFKKVQSKSSNIYNEEFKRFYPEIVPFDLYNKYSDYHYSQKEPDRSDFYRTRDLSYMDSFLKSKRGVPYGKRFDLLESSPADYRKPSAHHANIFKEMQLNKEREMMRNLHIKPEELERNYRNLEKLRYDIYRENSKKLSDLYDKSYKADDLRKSQSADFAPRTESSQILNNLEDQVGNLMLERRSELNNLNDLYEINVILQDPIKYITKIKIHKNKPLSVLKKSIADELCEKYPAVFRKIKEDSFLLMKNYAIVRDDSTIESAKLNDGDTVYILLHERFEKIKFKEETSNSKLNRKESNVSNANESKKKRSAVRPRENKELKGELAPIEKLPKLERKGYYTIPSYSEICRMSLRELENVENFTIYNEFGKIVFEGLTDLTELNIDQIVNISEREITLYRNGRDKITPDVGKGLNKPATIYMYKLYPENVCEDDYDDKEDYPKLLSCLEDLCGSMGAEFKDYDKEKGILTFRVEHF